MLFTGPCQCSLPKVDSRNVISKIKGFKVAFREFELRNNVALVEAAMHNFFLDDNPFSK